MSTFVMSDKYPQFICKMKKAGHSIITTDTIDIFHKPEQKHADMQVLSINHNTFILNECTGLKHKLQKYHPIICTNKAGKSYPENILLNFLYFKNCLYGKKDYIDNSVKEYCLENNIKIVNVNQGYCRCSTLIVSENAVITSDKSIEKVLKNVGAEVLRIREGYIKLKGFDHGFIGGASGQLDGNTIVFFGNIKNHPDYSLIFDFCKKHNKSIKILFQDSELVDIGGIVKVE